MNKTMIYGMLTALFALASCMGNGNPVSLSDLEGEWNVVELAGQSVNTKQQPFIGFDTREMRVYGYGYPGEKGLVLTKYRLPISKKLTIH